VRRDALGHAAVVLEGTELPNSGWVATTVIRVHPASFHAGVPVSARAIVREGVCLRDAQRHALTMHRDTVRPTSTHFGGIRRGPTIAVLRILARHRTTSWLGTAVEGLLVEVGDGEPTPSDLIQVAVTVGTALWGLIGLAFAGLAIVVYRWAPAIVETCLWAAAVSAIGCTGVWAGRAVWWNLRLARAKGQPIPLKAMSFTEWLALAFGFGWGLYWARPR
jgi:hypothetical protein